MQIKDIILIDEVTQKTGTNSCLWKGEWPTNSEAGELLKNNKNHPFSLLELGNQYLKAPFNGPAKKYFNKIGISHTSIDLNGASGALKLDLTQDLRDVFKEKFDIITNFGTSEHVRKQYPCWANIHNLCKKEGHFVMALPPVGGWKDHGDCWFWYTEKFFEELTRLNDYDIIKMYRRGSSAYPKLMLVIKKNKDNEFMSEKEFQNIESLFYTKWDGHVNE